MGELNGHIEEMYTGHNIVKVFGHEQNAIAEFDEINDELYRVSRKAQFISGTIMPLLGFINNISYVLICVAGGSYVLSGSISLGDVTSFIMYSKMTAVETALTICKRICRRTHFAKIVICTQVKLSD